jgi:hypothetical protein
MLEILYRLSHYVTISFTLSVLQIVFKTPQTIDNVTYNVNNAKTFTSNNIYIDLALFFNMDFLPQCTQKERDVYINCYV